MMDELLDLCRKQGFEAEITRQVTQSETLSHAGGVFKEIQSEFPTNTSLRILKNGRTGVASTRNLTHPGRLFETALRVFDAAAQEGPESLPNAGVLSWPAPHRMALDQIPMSFLADEATHLDALAHSLAPEAEVETGVVRYGEDITFLSTTGARLNHSAGGYVAWWVLQYQGGGAAVHQSLQLPAFQSVTAHHMAPLVSLFNSGLKEVKIPRSGSMPVLFLPSASSAWHNGLAAALSPQRILDGSSRLKGREGEKVLSSLLTLRTVPVDGRRQQNRLWDDEGTLIPETYLLREGIFETVPVDLTFAQKLGIRPNGNAVRQESGQVGPSFAATRQWEYGSSSVEEMIRSMDHGVVMGGCLGAHSGNIPNGDFSVGVSPAWWVEKGEIVGRIKDTLISGNVWDALKRVRTVEAWNPMASRIPALLVDGVQVTG